MNTSKLGLVYVDFDKETRSQLRDCNLMKYFNTPLYFTFTQCFQLFVACPDSLIPRILLGMQGSRNNQ